MHASSTPESLFDTVSDSQIEGVVRKILYSDLQSSWTVLRLQPRDRRSVITVVGPLYGVQPGERLRLRGGWVKDRKFGHQFQADSFLSLQPNTLTGIERYLGSGLIPGIGKVMAARLVHRFGLEALDVIESRPARLTEVEGIGPVRAERIQQAWRKQRGIREILIFLQSHGISAGQASKIYRHYGERAVAALKSNPYKLAEEIFGFGFHTADDIASRLGMSKDAPVRSEAGLLHVLARAEAQGHVYLPEDRLLATTVKLLELPREAVQLALDRLLSRRELMRQRIEAAGKTDAIYRSRLLATESEIASRVHQLLSPRRNDVDTGWRQEIDRFERHEHLQLSALQREAVHRALTEKLLIITGGPGTGKTTLVRAVVEIQAAAGRRVLLAAPTGRAAKRLAEATRAEAKTVHRLLEFEPRGPTFQRHRDRPLDADVVIIDESSMLDCPLTQHLLDALPDLCRLILVGDVDQLPSVGPGRVLADLIDSARIPVVRLTEVYRQAARSLIVANAHRIRRGQLPSLETRRPVDFYFIERRQPDELLDTLVHLVNERIPRRFGLDPRRDIQLLTPMRKGLVGVENLNKVLQDLLNADSTPLELTRGRLRAGDRVMQLRNNYELEVYNGDIGHVLGPDKEREGIVVDFDGREIGYRAAEIDELALAYACSVHKSQGSEYPCVLMPLHSQHYVMLQRNLLYTAVTRGQRLVILVGEQGALAQAVRNDRPQERFTLLARRLRELA